MIFTPFIFGVLSASLALVFELVFLNLGGVFSYSAAPPSFTQFSTLLAAAIIEECARYFLLFQYFRRFPSLQNSSWRSLLSLGISFGIGFVSIEMILLLQQSSAPFWPLFGIVILHFLLGLFYTARLGNKLRAPLVFILSTGILIHLLYNTALLLLP